MPKFNIHNTLTRIGALGGLLAILLLVNSATAFAQDSTASRSGSDTESKAPDPLGDRDTLFVNVESTGKSAWTVDVSTFNDEELFGLSIPLKFTSGLRRVYVDSTIFTGGRVDHFQIKLARADSAIQRLTIGLIAALSPHAKVLAAGEGSLAKVYLHADGDSKKGLKVDTTTTAPQNSLLFIYSDMKDGNLQLKVHPEVVINGELAVKPKGKADKKSKK